MRAFRDLNLPHIPDEGWTFIRAYSFYANSFEISLSISSYIDFMIVDVLACEEQSITIVEFK